MSFPVAFVSSPSFPGHRKRTGVCPLAATAAQMVAPSVRLGDLVFSSRTIGSSLEPESRVCLKMACHRMVRHWSPVPVPSTRNRPAAIRQTQGLFFFLPPVSVLPGLSELPLFSLQKTRLRSSAIIKIYPIWPYLTRNDKFLKLQKFSTSLWEKSDKPEAGQQAPERNGPGSEQTGLSPVDPGTDPRRTDRPGQVFLARLRKILLSMTALDCPDSGEPSGFFSMPFCPCHPYIRIGNGDGRHDS